VRRRVHRSKSTTTGRSLASRRGHTPRSKRLETRYAIASREARKRDAKKRATAMDGGGKYEKRLRRATK